MATRKNTYTQPSTFEEQIRQTEQLLQSGYRVRQQSPEPVEAAAPPERSTARAIGDLATQFAGGAVSGVRMMSDVFGADNAVSGGLRSAEQALSALQSAAAKADQQEIARIMQEAEGKGWGEQIASGLKAFGVAPGAMMAQALGTSIPTLATGLIPGAGPAAVVARIGAAGAAGAAQGAGNIKGIIYEEVKNKPLPGETPEQTEARAIRAQEYGGENSGQIALGGGLGFVAGSTGMERVAAGLRNGVTQAAPGMIARVGTGAVTEMVPELAQGVQEKYAGNTALANEGFDVDPWSGAIASGVMGAAAGGVMGGAFGIPNPAVRVEQTPGDTIRQTETVPESGPMTRAANTATEQKAQAADAEALRLGFNPLAGTPVVFPDGSVALGSEQEQAKRAEVAGQEAQANQAANIEQFAARRPPMVASDAARILEEAKGRGLDFAAAPHPQGGFMVVPSNWVTPQVAQQAQAELNDTLSRMQAVDAQPVQRAPRTGSATAQELNLNTDPVTGYVDSLRQVNTPAAKLFVRDFDAGTITPQDVQARMDADRTKTPDERLAAAAAEGLRMNPKGDPFKTLFAAQRATRQTPGDVIEVQGGYAIRPQPEPTSEPAPVDATAFAAPTEAAPPALADEPSAAPTLGSAEPAVPAAEPEQPAALSYEQDAPQGTDGTLINEGTTPEAAPAEAPAPEASDAATAAGVPDAAGAGDVQAAGVAPSVLQTVATQEAGKLEQQADQLEQQPNATDLDKSRATRLRAKAQEVRALAEPVADAPVDAGQAAAPDVAAKKGKAVADRKSSYFYKGETWGEIAPQVWRSPDVRVRKEPRFEGTSSMGAEPTSFDYYLTDGRRQQKIDKDIAEFIESQRPADLPKNPPKIDTSAKPVQKAAEIEQVDSTQVPPVPPAPQDAALPPVLSARLQEAHKAHGRDVKRSVVERAIANARADTTGTPKAKRERADRIKRLEADLALFDEAAKPKKETAIDRRNRLIAEREAAQQPASSDTPAAPVYLGRGSQPVGEGGKPFKTDREARREKAMHPEMRVVKNPTGKGFVLAPKTARQIAADAAKAKRLRLFNSGTPGKPTSAHEFVVSAGGMAPSTRSELGVEGNPRVGNRTLFAGAGKPGLTLEQAAMKLKEAGYITDEGESSAADIIKRSLTNPQYTPEGWEAVAESEREAEFQDYMAAQQEEASAQVGEDSPDFDPFGPVPDFSPDELADAGYDSATPEIKAEVDALVAMAEAQGIDTETLREDAARATADQTEQEYYEQARQLLQQAISANAGSRSNNSAGRDGQGQQGEAQRGGDEDRGKAAGEQGSEGLTTPTPAEAQPAAAPRTPGNGFQSASVAPPSDGIYRLRDGSFARYQDGVWWREKQTPREALKTEFASASMKPKDRTEDQAWIRYSGFTLDAYGATKALSGIVKPTAPEQPQSEPGPITPGLTAPTRSDIEAQQDRAEQAERDKAAADKAAEAQAAKQRERAEVKRLSEAAADTFELGGDAMANLTGQTDIFGGAPEAESAPAAQETGSFGPILTQYRGDAQGAIKALTELQDGEAVAVLNHPEVGDIDLVWGKEGTRESNGFGLAKLVKWHPEVLDDLQGVVSSLAVAERTENRIQLESDKHKAAVRLEWDKQAKHWLLTAFEKKDTGGGTRTDTAANVAEGDTARLGAGRESVPQPSQPKQETTPTTRIEDFGEKLAGARKDYAALMKDAMAVDVAAVPLSKSWPEPDYQKLLDGGADVRTVAMVRSMRDEVPTKPQKSWKLSGWVQQVNGLRDFAQDLMTGKMPYDQVRSELAKVPNLRAEVLGRADLYEAVGHAKSLGGFSFQQRHYSLYKGESNATKWVVEHREKASTWPREFASADTKEAAIEQFKARQNTKSAEPKTSFVIYRKRNTPGAFVGKKIGREHIDLHKAEDVPAARKYLQENPDALEKALERYKETPYERNEENAPRVGADHRNGAPVTAEAFAQAFGFRGVQFGNYVEQGRRQSDLNEAFDGLMDMAAVLGVPPKALSLNGRLGLAFGARGKGGKNAPAAHYEGGNMVINLTKGGGPGSLAHEWFHAMDNYFAMQAGEQGFMTDSAKGDSLRAEMKAAFAAIKRAVMAGSLEKRSTTLDKRRSKPYWATPVEMSARSFESYVIAKLQDQNAANDYLANVVSEEGWNAAESLRGEASEKEGHTYPYPTVDEMPVLRAAFDDFFKTVQTKEDDAGNVAMFSRQPIDGPATLAEVRASLDRRGIKTSIFERDGVIALSQIIVPQDVRGGGIGTAAMNELVAYADRTGQRIALSPSTDFGGNKARLVQFYKRFGFVENKGRNKDFTISEAMVREPVTAGTFDPDNPDIRYSRTDLKAAKAAHARISQNGVTSPDDLRDMLRVPGYSQWAQSTIVGDVGATKALRAELEKAFPGFDWKAPKLNDQGVITLYPDWEGASVDSIKRLAALADRYDVPVAVRGGAGVSPRLFEAAGFVPYNGMTETADRLPETLFSLIRPAGGITDTTPLFSFAGNTSAARPPKGLPASAAAQIVDAIKARWANAPEIVVAADMNDPAIPQAVRKADAQQRSQGATGEPEGFFYKGKVYVVAGALNNPADVVRVLFHETLGHAGLRGVFGESLTPILKQMAALRKTEVAAKAKEYGLDMGKESERLQAAEEVLAVMAQTQPELGYVKRAIAAIRAFLRKNVPGFAGMKLTDADIIQQYILPARRFVEGGGGPRGGVPAPAFSRSQDQTDTPAFRKWFGDSKVVDAEGKPLVVYHGTKGSFDRFNKKRTGTGSTMFGDYEVERHGIFVTPSAVLANEFATQGDRNKQTGANVMPLYASIQNPLDMTQGYTDSIFNAVEKWGNDKDLNGYRIARNLGDNWGDWMLFDEDVGQDPAFLIGMLKDLGYDGVKIYEPKVAGEGASGDTYVAFEPTQIKSSTGNNGQFDPANPDIRFSRTQDPDAPGVQGAPSGQWDAPMPSKWDDYVYKLQDKLVDLKRVTRSITQWSGKLADDINVYLQEELYHGRTAKRVQDFTRMELEPALKQLAAGGYQMADLEEYLHARHAKEANRVIAERNPDDPGLQDGGSGMTDAEADAYFAKLPKADADKLAAVAAQFDAIMSETNRLMVEYELEPQSAVDAWGKMFKHYVPLHREDKQGGRGTGQGFSIKGRETKGRTGSKRKVVDIVSHIAAAREKTVVRGEKNRVAQALVGLVTAHPNQDFWKVGPPDSERVFNPKTGLVEDRVSPLYKSQPNVVMAKVAKEGVVTEVAVTFNADDERAVRLASALKNLDTPQIEGLLGTVGKMTRYFAAINTQYNPVFGVVNLVRDVQGAMINLGHTELADQKTRVAKDAVLALSGIYKDIRATRKGGSATSEWSKLYDQFQNDGGQTGFRDLFATPADRTDDLNNLIDPNAWSKRGVGKVVSVDGKLVRPMNQVRKVSAVVFDWLSDYNEALENGVRLAAYKAGLDKGMTRQQAASLAKNLTVNFNRKGISGAQAGAVYAFFNAAMQGTARLGEVLVTMDPGKPKTMRLSPFGKKVVYGGMTVGMLQALALAAAGFDDDEVPDFVRERNLVIPTGGKTFITIPMPLGLHVVPNVGRIASEFVLDGFSNPMQRTAQLFGLFADAFNPIGNAGLSMQTLAPTVLDPLVALTENKDWTGKPIARVSSNPDLPGHAQHKDSASWVSKFLAETINTLSGGNEYVAGVISPTPDQIDYLAGQLGGGVWRELSKTEQTATNIVTGEELPIHKVPLLGRFVGNAAGQSSEGNAFYSNANKLNRLETEIKGLEKEGKLPEANALRKENPEARLMQAFNRAERQIQKLRREKRALVEAGAETERVKALEKRITTIMSNMNKRMASAEG